VPSTLERAGYMAGMHAHCASLRMIKIKELYETSSHNEDNLAGGFQNYYKMVDSKK
jgi:hypothetical protein